jgi:hypothetical protein
MPKTKGIFRCGYCGNEMEVNSFEFKTCECGKSQIKLSDEGFFINYNNDYDYKGELTNKETIYEEIDFFKLSEETLDLINKLKNDIIRVSQNSRNKLGYDIDCDYYTFKEKLEDESVKTYAYFFEFFTKDYFNQFIRINYSIDIKDDNLNEDEIKEDLNKFINFVNDVENHKIIFNNPYYMKEHFDWTRKQKPLYDYEFDI